MPQLARASFALCYKNAVFVSAAASENLLRASFSLGCKNPFSSLSAPAENLPEQVSPWRTKTQFSFSVPCPCWGYLHPKPAQFNPADFTAPAISQNALRDHFFKMIRLSSVTIGSDPGGHGFSISSRNASEKNEFVSVRIARCASPLLSEGIFLGSPLKTIRRHPHL